MAEEQTKAHPNSKRELFESLIVAFILAFLFKTFVAEVFVIPTGSMAPTLMGAHKDLFCPECGYNYQSGSSIEFNPSTGEHTDSLVIGAVCPICRAQNNLDLRNEPNDATFSGDRIVVGKFNYLFSDPKRWDVIVFKFPKEARTNYIKRLIGEPGEEILIQHGDIYTRPNLAALAEGNTESNQEKFVIARKPADKVSVLLQPVNDTSHMAPLLVANGWPTNWQEWPKREKPIWSVKHTDKEFEAKLESASDQPVSLRYFHRFAVSEQWREMRDIANKTATAENPLDEMSISATDPYGSTLITDFACYNASIRTDRGAVFLDNGRIRESYKGGEYPDQWLPASVPAYFGQSSAESEDGNHWVGDLAVEMDVEVPAQTGTSSQASKLTVDLVEAGVRYQAVFDLTTGEVRLEILRNGQPVEAWVDTRNEATTAPTAKTAVRSGGRYRIRLANVDDALHLWVNGSLVRFSGSTWYDTEKFLPFKDRRPYWTSEDPLDAAPIGLTAERTAAIVRRMQVWRDVYYIAVLNNQPSTDFDWDSRLISYIPDPAVRQEFERFGGGSYQALEMTRTGALAWIYQTPESWEKTALFANRRTRKFELGEGEFFPMGDNSAASSDARSWTPNHFVPRELLIGKALVLLWPHAWNRPVPLLPNFRRMGVIR